MHSSHSADLPTPLIAVVKSSTPASVTAVGQVVPYRFTVTQLGNITLTGLLISDRAVRADAGRAATANADSKLQRTRRGSTVLSHTVHRGGRRRNLSNTVTVDSAVARARSFLVVQLADVLKHDRVDHAAGQVVP